MIVFPPYQASSFVSLKLHRSDFLSRFVSLSSKKWNERLFCEMLLAYKNGRAEKHPKEFWYKGELGFFDFYIIPLAKKLKDCGVSQVRMFVLCWRMLSCLTHFFPPRALL